MIERLRESVAKRHRVIVFGTPAVLLEACRIMEEQGLRLELPEGSSVSYGGGWKSFSGTRISETELVALLRRTFGVSRTRSSTRTR